MPIEQPSYYAILTAAVRYDKTLCPMAKILCAEVTALANKEGYCYAGNDYFAELYDVDSGTVSGWVKQLMQAGHVTTDMAATSTGSQRRIWIQRGGVREKPETPRGGVGKKPEGGVREKPDHNIKDLNTRAPPLPPLGGSPEDQNPPDRQLDLIPSNGNGNGKRKICYDYDERAWHGIVQADVDFWQDDFDGVDVREQLKVMKAWLDSHPKKKDFKKFISNWLIRAQSRSTTFAGRKEDGGNRGRYAR